MDSFYIRVHPGLEVVENNQFDASLSCEHIYNNHEGNSLLLRIH